MKHSIRNQLVNLEDVKAIHDEVGISYLMAAYISARGIKVGEDLLEYLDPLVNLSDPFLLPDIEEACKRIILAINKKEKIFVVGDFDFDGITSTAIILRFFKKIGNPISFILPEQVDGHGITSEIVKRIHREHGKLIITVDNGVTSFEAVDEAKKNKIDVIITDHHNFSSEGSPKAYAIVNPKKLGTDSPIYHLSGGGVAFYLIRALAFILSQEHLITEEFYELAALSTVGDLVPLVKDNRKIVKTGLKNLKNTKIAGLKLLLQKRKYSAAYSARDVSFKIAPIINSASKFGLVNDAIKVFTETNVMLLTSIIERFSNLNEDRKDGVNLAFPPLLEKAKIQVEEGCQVLVLEGDHLPAYSGILAARMVEHLQKPTVVVSFDSQETGKASCRSTKNFNISGAIEVLKDYHMGGGGHHAAAGFLIRKDQLTKFKDEINCYYKKIQENALLGKVWSIDADCSIEQLSKEDLNTLKILGPFGPGNENLSLLLRNVVITRGVGKSKGIAYFINIDGENVRVYPHLESGKVTLDKKINAIIEITQQEGNPLIVLKDYELVESGEKHEN